MKTRRLLFWTLALGCVAMVHSPSIAWSQIYRASFRQEPARSPSDMPPAPPLPPGIPGADPDDVAPERAVTPPPGAAAGPGVDIDPDAVAEPDHYPPTPYYDAYTGVPNVYGEACNTCGPGYNFCNWGPPVLPSHWAKFEYLQWWRKGTKLPPLVAVGGAGALDDPQTTVVVGGDEFGPSPRIGGRVELGLWMDSQQTFGIGGRYWNKANDPNDFTVAGGNTPNAPFVARPFIDPDTGMEEAVIVSGVDADGIFATGSVGVDVDHTSHGGDFFVRYLLQCDCCSRLEMLAGVQFTKLDESLRIVSRRQIMPAPFVSTDIFDTSNDYSAGTIGLLYSERRGRWTFDLLGKIGFGEMEQRVVIDGSSTGAQPNAGFLAQPTNIGVYGRSEFAVSPEVNLTAAWNLVGGVDITMGYSFIYWSEVVQPGEQIDRRVDLTQDANSTNPDFTFQSDGFWLQGINMGVRWAY